MADEERPFLIQVRRRWKLWILPVIATLYFAAIITLAVMDYRIKGVPMSYLVLGGLAFFILVMIIELPFLWRKSAPRPKRVETAPLSAAPEAASRNGWDDEMLVTAETQQGMQVLEYSAPAKSRNRNAVYTKTYVPVTGAQVLRIESLVADAADL